MKNTTINKIKNIDPDLRANIVSVLSQHEEFLIIGLTGRTGSGCSEAAEILASDYRQLQLPQIDPGFRGFTNDEERDISIIHRFFCAHWVKFDIVRARTLISSFLLEDWIKLEDYIKKENNDQTTTGETSDKNTNESFVFKFVKKKDKEIYEKLRKKYSDKNKESIESNNNSFELIVIGLWIKIEKLLKKVKQKQLDPLKIEYTCKTETEIKTEFDEIKKSLNNDQIIQQLFDRIRELYNLLDKGACLYERSRFLSETEEILFDIVSLKEHQIVEGISTDTVFFETMKDYANKTRQDMDRVTKQKEKNSIAFDRFTRFVFVHDLMPLIDEGIQIFLKEMKISYIQFYQKLGNLLRRYEYLDYELIIENKVKETNNENITINETEDYNEVIGNETPIKIDIKYKQLEINTIPKTMVRFIKALRHIFDDDTRRPARIVINSIKNVNEATYLRQRYSSFYLFAISADEDIRKKRLWEGNKELTSKQIKFFDWNESSGDGFKIYDKKNDQQNKASSTDSDEDIEKSYHDYLYRTSEEDGEEEKKDKFYNLWNDIVRKESFKQKSYYFYLQDVALSIENADIFIANNYTGNDVRNIDLILSLIRNVCLIMSPGLVLPTPYERCMQIAFAAKCNSGCLSRQVGAVVTDKDFNILSIGWNDVPCGDISCSRKNFRDLARGEDKAAYSDFELSNPTFRKTIKEANSKLDKGLNETLRGLPLYYCFKDIHQEEKNSMRSRAMHAEEKALANCGKEAEGGYLFTTSSPCEMCSKNAKNHKIKKIIYIELYPGISKSQYSSSGDKENRAEHILFSGAVGRAYTQIYTPIMPKKDVLTYLGIDLKDKIYQGKNVNK